MSPIHANGRLNILFLSLVLISILGVYIKSYNSALLTLLLLISLKITHIYIEINKYFKDRNYKDWLDFKNDKFIQKIFKYSGYIFYVTSIGILIILFSQFYSYSNEEYLYKMFNVLITIGYFIVIMAYVDLSIKFKE